MSIPARVWRLLKSELNSRLGRFGTTSRRPYQWARDTYNSQRQGSRTSSDYSGQAKAEAKWVSYYRVLELPYGAPLYNVKASYKRLMKKYHPDKFQNEEQKRMATELVKKLNEAYAELTKHLESSRPTNSP